MSKETIIHKAESVLLHTYNRFPIVFDHGKGVYLYDTDGNKYLDFAAGIAVCALGYHYPGFDEALKDQIDKLTHISNLFYSEPNQEAGEMILSLSGMSKVFFTNSGAEAIEGALKSAKKYACKKKGHAGGEIIAMQHSFHGRTIGALSVTGTDHYREPFEPLMGGVHFATFNDLDSVKACINENTCAIILEPIQGEGGIYPADPEFLKGVRALCDEHDILLIFDEIQCGLGRSGYAFAHQAFGVKPDILTVAKALGNGVPVGAFLLNEKAAASSLEAGDHGSTYGGNPFVCAAVVKTLSIFEEDGIIDNVKETAPYLEKALDGLVEAHPLLKGHRGMGFMQGIMVDPSVPVGKICSTALENGLVVISAGGNVLRLVPPLIIEKKHIAEMARKLDKTLTQLGV